LAVRSLQSRAASAAMPLNCAIGVYGVLLRTLNT